MQKTPEYLRLHTEETRNDDTAKLSLGADLDSLCRTFTEATGWPLRVESDPNSRRHDRRASTSETRRDAHQVAIDFQSSESITNVAIADPQRAQDHVAEINGLLGDLQRTRYTLWQREAELAAGVPVVKHEREEDHLAFRLESVLQNGAEAVGCRAAALYMLNETTSELKLRACWELPRERFNDPARPLRGAVADLEALLGHAVVLKDTSVVPHWKAPEDFPAAVCVPVSTPTTLLGTLWVFADEVADFGEQETNLLEIVAGRLAADLEREVLLQQGIQAKHVELQLAQAADSQRSRLPNIAPLLDGWQVAGWTAQADAVGGDFYDWGITPDNRLILAVGDAEGDLINAAVTAAAMQSAIKTHGYYQHDPRSLLDRVNETLWTSSAGDQFASLFYSQIVPETGVIEYSAAGCGGALILRQGQYDVLSGEEDLLGNHEAASYSLHSEMLGRGDVLIVFSQGVSDSLKKLAAVTAGDAFAAALRHKRDLSAEEILQELRDLLNTYDASRHVDDRTLLVAKRI